MAASCGRTTSLPDAVSVKLRSTGMPSSWRAVFVVEAADPGVGDLLSGDRVLPAPKCQVEI
jgi:hypothetical protein